MKYCKNKKYCEASTMTEFEEGLCDKCWTIENHAENLHTELMNMQDEAEPMDGDETERVSKIFLAKLNKLNGNE